MAKCQEEASDGWWGQVAIREDMGTQDEGGRISRTREQDGCEG